MREIVESVQQLAGTQLTDKVDVVLVEVTEVDMESRTVSGVTVSGVGVTDIINIQLTAGVSDGFIIVPSVGSTIGVLYSKRTEPCIVLYSDIDELQITTGDSYVDVKSGLTSFNDGSFGGLVKIGDLVKKMNAYETAINDIHALLLLIVPKLPPSVPPIVVPDFTVPITAQSDIENPLITHGK